MKEYFSHDYNARNDKKLIKIFMKYGVMGLGIYWCIVEMLYEESGYIPTNEYERIAFELRTNYDIIKDVIENFDLFSFDNDKFWSESALSRLKERMAKSKKARESVMNRWKRYKRNTNVIRDEYERNTSKVKESKEYINIIYNIMSFFNFTEIKNHDKLRQINLFLNILKTEDKFEYFLEQFEGYKKYKEKSGEKKHSFNSFIGTIENKFMDGGWNARNWVKENPNPEKKVEKKPIKGLKR